MLWHTHPLQHLALQARTSAVGRRRRVRLWVRKLLEIAQDKPKPAKDYYQEAQQVQ
jgi:hypothetical protein